MHPRDAVRAGSQRLRQNLERHVATELRIARAIDLAHSAFAEFGDDFIGTDSCAYLHRLSSASARPRRSSRDTGRA
jgi:hypothetical protein